MGSIEDAPHKYNYFEEPKFVAIHLPVKAGMGWLKLNQEGQRQGHGFLVLETT